MTTINLPQLLESRIIHQIQCDLTIGRRDNNLSPYTDDQLKAFMTEHRNEIQGFVQQIITEYEVDDELDYLMLCLCNHENVVSEYIDDFIVPYLIE